jgi:opacity protein-like surface antigen
LESKKSIVIGILVFFITSALFSQDIIVKKDKSEIRAKIIEIGETSIKYNLFEFLGEPPRSIQISNVLEIIHESGRIEKFGVTEEVKVTPPIINNTVAVSQQPSQEASNPSSYPWRVFAKVSFQVWNSSDVSDYYGDNLLLGGGIEKQLSDDFKIRGDADFGSTKKEDLTLTYSQLGVSVKYGWHPFGSKRPNICGGLGVKYISLKESGDDEVEKGNSIGFSALLGVEIPLGEKVILDFGWDTVWSKMNYDSNNLNVGSEIFYGGFIFSF